MCQSTIPGAPFRVTGRTMAAIPTQRDDTPHVNFTRDDGGRGLSDGPPPMRVPRLWNVALSLFAGLRQYGYGSSADGLGEAIRFGPPGRQADYTSRARSANLRPAPTYSADRMYVPATYVGQVRANARR